MDCLCCVTTLIRVILRKYAANKVRETGREKNCWKVPKSPLAVEPGDEVRVSMPVCAYDKEKGVRGCVRPCMCVYACVSLCAHVCVSECFETR